MLSLLARRQLVIAVLSAVTLVAAGCGGAESRKARHMAKGQTFLAKGNVEKARIEFRNALQIAPNDSEVRYENGVADEKLGNVREAAQFYQGAIDTNADNVGARASLGRLYVLSGVPDKALATVKPSLDKHPDDAALLTVRAAARAQLKDPDGALKDAEKVGLGHVLAETIFALAVRLGLEKIIAQMMADQEGAIRVFELLGFNVEATLRNHVKDRYGHKHDLIVMANDLALTTSPDPERMYVRQPR